MTNRIKESERRIMLMDYARDGTIPDGFYVVKTKKNQIQFRHQKASEMTIEKVKAKIELHKKRLQEYEKLYNEMTGETAEEPEI